MDNSLPLRHKKASRRAEYSRKNRLAGVDRTHPCLFKDSPVAVWT